MSSSFQDIGTGFRISLSDLLHEWKLSLCLVLAISAVIAPLLLLFGLKYGTIATLRSRLVQDPKNREIIPVITRNYNQEWFKEMAGRPDIAFVLPTTRQIAASIDVRLEKSEKAKASRLDIIPTGPGDALLLDNGAVIPGEGECVLSRLAADEIGAKSGDRLQCTINRTREGKFETVTFPLTVLSVLPDRAGVQKAVYTPLDLVEAVETYRDGRAVSRYGWSGELARAHAKFDGFILVCQSALSERDQLTLAVGTGLSQIRPVSPDEMPALLGFKLPETLFVYLLHVVHTPVSGESLDAVREKLRGRDVLIIPYVKPLNVHLAKGGSAAGSGDLPLLSYWATAETLQKLGQPHLPVFEEVRQRQNAASLLRIVVPGHMQWVEPGDQVTMTMKEADRTLSFPVQVVAKSDSLAVGLVPSELMGIANTLRQREVFFNESEKDFLLGRMSYAGFRMYARTIDDVEPLRQFLVAEGIDVSTRADDIERVKSMDRGLTRVFWLVAIVGILGCMAALIASLASSVERKKRDLSVMRLMGIGGWLIFQIPVSQSVLLGLGGFLAASAGFGVIALIINGVFAKDLMPGEKMCALASRHFAAALLSTLAVVLVSSFFSAWQATRIDPAEALRDE